MVFRLFKNKKASISAKTVGDGMIVSKKEKQTKVSSRKGVATGRVGRGNVFVWTRNLAELLHKQFTTVCKNTCNLLSASPF